MPISNADLLLIPIMLVGILLMNKEYIQQNWLSNNPTKKGYPPQSTDNPSS